MKIVERSKERRVHSLSETLRLAARSSATRGTPPPTQILARIIHTPRRLAFSGVFC